MYLSRYRRHFNETTKLAAMKRLLHFLTSVLLIVLIFCNYRCQKNPGELRVMDDSTQFVKYVIAGMRFNFLTPDDSISTSLFNSSINVWVFSDIFIDSAHYKFTSFNFSNVTAPGTYLLDAGSLLITRGIYPHSDIDYHDKGPVTVTITEFGPSNGYIAGSYSGTLESWFNNATVTFSCNFRVKRLF